MVPVKDRGEVERLEHEALAPRAASLWGHSPGCPTCTALRGDDDEDPRALMPGVCRVTRSTGIIEWICIAPVHDEAPRPGHGHRSSQHAGLGGAYPARSERHHFVNRWPNRTLTAS